MKTFNSIKFRLTSGISFLIIAITVLLSVLSYEYERRAIQNRIYAQLNATADLKKELVVNYVDERMNNLRILATAEYLRSSIFSLLDKKAGIQKTGQYRYISQRLQSFKNIHRDYLSIEVADLKGNIIVSTNDSHSNSNHSHKHEHREGISRYMESIKRGGAVVMQDYLNAEARHLDFAIGIRSEDGNVRAVIVSSVVLNNTISPIFSDYTGLGHTGETLLVKLSDHGLMHINPTRHSSIRKIETPGHGKERFRLGTSAASGSEGIDEGIDYRGKRVVGAYRHVPLLNWGIVVKMDVEEAFREITILRKKIFIIGILILGIMLPTSYFIANRFTAPLVSLKQKTKAVAAGDYSIRIESGRKNEIGELERDFNEMVDALDKAKTEIESKQRELEEANYELERKVQERTAELTESNAALLEVLEDIKSSEEKFRNVIDSSVDAVVISDALKKIQIFNKAAEDMFGYRKEDIIGREIEILIPEKYKKRHRNGFEKYIANGRGTLLGSVVELEALKRDGKEFPVELSLSGWESKGRKYISAVIRDITGRKKAEEEIRKLSYAVEQSPVSILITDTKGNITYANDQLCKITGYSREELIGQNPRILKSGETSPEEYKRLWDTITSGDVWTGVFHNKKKNGELFWESAIISPITNKEGVITHFIGIKEDITEKKKLEEMLFHSQKMEAIGQLAGGIAHDFNNMLSAIIGFGGLINMNMSDDDPNRTYLKEILAAGERASHLTQGLLAFSRKQIINPKPVSLNEIIRSIEKLLRRIIREDIELKTILADRDLTVMADPGQIEQVLMNLTTNARDAMSRGGILTINTELIRLDNEFIKTHGYGEKGEYALISVSDTGVGMDQKTKERIFEPFFTTKEMGKGTGLGLAIVYGIIKQHNGYINCYSEPGKGTTFRIYMPLISPEFEKIEPAAVPELKGGSETVLVAEDDAVIRKLTRNVLERFGYKVIEAFDGEDAIRKFMDNKDKIHILLFDVIMPKKNGKEAYEEIKKIRPDIKSIFISGYTADIIHEKGILDEEMNFISKPVSPKDLLRKVREVLDN